MAGASPYRTLRARLADLQAAASDRLLDAEALYAAGRYASSIAMGIYSLEIALKVRICQRLGLTALPKPFEIHDLDGLLILSGLSAAKDAASAVVQSNWDFVTDPALDINDLRYLASGGWTQAQAQDFLRQLRDPPDGILPWLAAQP
jgi:hypothetical protein